MTLPSGIVVNRIGAEAEPLVVIDDFAADPQALVDRAAADSFSPRGVHYPGIRAPVQPAYLAERLDVLEPVLRDVFGLGRGAELAESAFSLVTTPPDDLTPIQRLPHFDTTDGKRLALLHYLCGPEQGGTAFYRHRSTGFETISAERRVAYQYALEDDVETHGLPEGYMNASGPIFEQTANVEARFNRMVIYRSRTLHSGQIPDDFTFSTDPRQGRLTVNIFLQGR